MSAQATAPLRARIPGYRIARRKARSVLRRSKVAMRIARGLASHDQKKRNGSGGSSAPMGFRPGRYFTVDDARKLPVVVVVATGLADGDAERLAREFEHAQMMAGSFRPLFVIDCPEFGPFRGRGYAVERVMRPAELAAANPDDSYSEYLFSRVRSIASDYGAWSVVPLPEGSIGSLDGRLVRLVGAVPPPS